MVQTVKGLFDIRQYQWDLINQKEQGAATNSEEWLISGLTAKH